MRTINLFRNIIFITSRKLKPAELLKASTTANPISDKYIQDKKEEKKAGKVRLAARAARPFGFGTCAQGLAVLAPYSNQRASRQDCLTPPTGA